MNMPYKLYKTTVAAAIGLAITTSSHAAVYTYDKLHRLTTVTYESGYRIRYSYDATGNILHIATSRISTVYRIIIGTSHNEVLVRSPDGVLEYQFPITQSGNGIAVAALDSDQDDTSEVAVAGDNTVAIYKLDGTEKKAFSIAEQSATLAVGDATQDDKPDIAAASQIFPSISASLYTLEGNSLGAIPLFNADTLFSLAAGDVDNDGFDDLIAGERNANEVSVNGLFSFTVFDSVAKPPHQGQTQQNNKVTVCHNPPGNPSAAQTISVSKNALQTHLNHGDSLGECPPTVYGVNVAVSDLDGDGQAEIIAAMADKGGRIEIYSGDGTLINGFNAFNNSRNGLVVTAGNVVGGPEPEIIVSEANGTKIRVFDETGHRITHFQGTDTGGIVSLAVGQEIVEIPIIPY
ncbi:MAG: hypothetical protein DRR08_29145 [Candidatus Parabeggiatoa sp. nov. 2]|nr:MAG: hypothetical protein B6247_30810 [Beggiatoa sp. 4572_84]RKZ51577.1 MAG: hypothetical protein DRR08_29145 [Gammaproteobacteria bacterium]